MGRMYKPSELVFHLENVDMRNVSEETVFLMQDDRYRFLADVRVDDAGAMHFQLKTALEEFVEYRLYFSEALFFTNGRPFPHPYFLRIRIKDGKLYAPLHGGAHSDEVFFSPSNQLIFTNVVSIYFDEYAAVPMFSPAGASLSGSGYPAQKGKKTGCIVALIILVLFIAAIVSVLIFASRLIFLTIKVLLADKLDASSITYTDSADYEGPSSSDTIANLVERAGGSTDGDLRASLLWNHGVDDRNDYDLMCVEPDGTLIYFAAPDDAATGGTLDVDIINPEQGVSAVENIVWTGSSPLPEGTYVFYVRNFTDRGGRAGFRGQIACGGAAYDFYYPMAPAQGEIVKLAECSSDGSGGLELILPEQDFIEE